MGDRVFVGSCSGRFYALQAETGAVAWSHDTARDGPPAQFHGDPVVTSEAVIVGSHSFAEGHLYSFARDSGRVLWKLPLAGGVATQVYRWGDTVLATTMGGLVVAVDPDTGASRWRHEAPEETRRTYAGDPILVGDRFFVPWRPGLLDAFDAGTGELLWRRRIDAELNTSAAVFSGEVLVGTLDGKLVRFASETGGLIGELDPGLPGGTLYGDLVPAEDCLIVLQAASLKLESLELIGPHSIACIRPASSRVVWTRRSDKEWTTLRPLIWRGTVVVGTKGSVQAFDLRDGSLLWDQPVDGVPRSLSASSTRLFIGIREGNLLALPWHTLSQHQVSEKRGRSAPCRSHRYPKLSW